MKESKRKVIARKNIPAFLPIRDTAPAYLMLAHFDAPGWLWGVVGTVVVLFWLAVLVAYSQEEQVDLFDRGVPKVATGRINAVYTYDGFDIDADGKVTTTKAVGR